MILLFIILLNSHPQCPMITLEDECWVIQYLLGSPSILTTTWYALCASVIFFGNKFSNMCKDYLNGSPTIFEHKLRNFVSIFRAMSVEGCPDLFIFQ